MKFYNTFLLVIIAAITLYAVFLLISDFKILTTNIIRFKVEFLPLILVLVPCGWLVLYVRWNLLLKNIDVNISFRKNLEIYLAGFTFSITPGRIGELIKSQLLKNKFDIPHRKTTSVILIERLYDLLGAVVASIASIWLFNVAGYVIIAALVILVLVFVLVSSRAIFDKLLTLTGKVKLMSKLLHPLSDSYEVIRISTRGKIAFLAAILSVSYWLITSFAVYLVLLAFGIDTIPYFDVVSTFTASLILGAVSFIPGGIGVAEGSLVGLFTLKGINASSAIVLVILIRIFTLWYSVAVGFVALKLSGVFSLKSSLP